MSIPIEIAKVFRFEAAHFLPNVGPSHQCRAMHGHSYKVTLRCFGPMDETLGWHVDLLDVSQAFAPWQKMLDHSLLNDIKGLENPTSENLAIWIMRILAKELPTLDSVSVSATDRLKVTIRRKDLSL